ncbi:large ribosomal subunit protein mL40 [Neocloeon triangulifer]|uniref:large ribosomal subunit protein mL40 n=1 Tax=Neocloeon triangulifer TaxID=2078957 RepID=UPI00286F9D60|nr:large ribosomal subunit protein mL40 [Neocloeon triangulifer]
MLCAALARLQLNPAGLMTLQSRTIFVQSNPNLFRITPCLLAEPMKKKKRIDPAVTRAREERRKKKIEKAIRKLEKNARQLKPIDELEIPPEVYDTLKQRIRKRGVLSHEEMEERALLLKEWSKYKMKLKLLDIQLLDRAIMSQQKALDELRLESEELYQEAVQMDLNVMPFTIKGPTHTPAIKDYDSPDGEYTDISKDWYQSFLV